MTELSPEALHELLNLAHNVVIWTGQATLNPNAAGYPALIAARNEYYRERIEQIAEIRPLVGQDYPGCSCLRHPGDDPDPVNCLYHYAASLQPWNHRIPWNCPTYYDGCNCDSAKASEVTS